VFDLDRAQALAFRPTRAAGELPASHQLLEVELPDTALSEDAALPALLDWRDDIAATRRCGDAWLASGRRQLLRVPSAVVGRSFNRLFNPLHPQAALCAVRSALRYPFDERLFGAGPH
jgi:RES domain-containing protein